MFYKESVVSLSDVNLVMYYFKNITVRNTLKRSKKLATDHLSQCLNIWTTTTRNSVKQRENNFIWILCMTTPFWDISWGFYLFWTLFFNKGRFFKRRGAVCQRGWSNPIHLKQNSLHLVKFTLCDVLDNLMAED